MDRKTRKVRPRYWKTYAELEKGKSYSQVGNKTSFFTQKLTRIPVSLGKFKGVNTKIGKGNVEYMFEKKNVKVTSEEALRPSRKTFILNCPKGGYGTRRATAKVRRHTRRRLPSK